MPTVMRVLLLLIVFAVGLAVVWGVWTTSPPARADSEKQTVKGSGKASGEDRPATTKSEKNTAKEPDKRAVQHTPPKPESYWNVDDVRPGMKGQGRTVMKGSKIETFDAEVLGVMKNSSPGRDSILCRLSGLDLHKTGVIGGMSGSPIYIDGKLLGAVAFTWAYGKEPIAGITPFSQMHGYVESFERRDLADSGRGSKVGLDNPIRVADRLYNSVSVMSSPDGGTSKDSDDLVLVPLMTPVSASGFSKNSLSLLREHLKGFGMTPVQAGSASAGTLEKGKDVIIEPGSCLALTLVRGDFDLTGIGTTTHVEGDRVYGWGHPFMSLGACEMPLMTGYIHTVYPRQTVSFKMGSALQTVGVINADVSTGIAGWLGRKPDMLPMTMTVIRPDSDTRVFNVEMARQRSLLTTLVFTCLSNSIDMEGDLPDEMTAELEMRLELEGYPPVVLKDSFSGASFSGGRAPQNLFSQISGIVGLLNQNPHKAIRINRIDCRTRVTHGRTTADVEAVELDSETYTPGDTVQATLLVRPYRGERRTFPISLKLPADLPEGTYTATICDDLNSARLDIRDNPLLSSPQTVEQILESLHIVTAAKRNYLVMRIAVPGTGVTVGTKALPNLPPGMVQVLSTSRRSGNQTMSNSLVARHPTEWIFNGSDTVKFTVTKNKKTLPPEN